MTQEKIKALAKEYAEWFMASKASGSAKAKMPDSLVNEAKEIIAADAEDMFAWLNGRFCIAEREKVIEAEKYPQRHCENIPGTLPIQANGVCKVLYDLFGTSMFNQNEE